MNVMETVKDILKENQGIDPATITGESTFDSLGIDSLDLVELICELEDRLDIDFGDPEGLKTMDDLVAYVESLK